MFKIVTMLVTAIPALWTYLLAFYSRKLVTVAAYVVAAASMLIVFIACINVILQTVLQILYIPEWLKVPLGIFIPSNFGMILAAMISARICRAAYDFAQRKADVMAQAN